LSYSGDADPDELKNCNCDFPARFYVHPNEYRPRNRVARQRWFRIEGKYKSRNAACDALNEVMATRQ